MTVTTKSALAAELAISKARVSQYVRVGMPVRADGKLNREEALNWISRNQASQTFTDKGAHRARKLAKDKPKPTRKVSSAGADREFAMAFEIVRMAERAVAEAAFNAGVSPEIAYAVASIALGEIDEAATRILAENGHEGFPDVSVLELVGRSGVPDYARLAKQRGLTFDEEAGSDLVDRLLFPPGWTPPENSPAARLASKRGGAHA